MNKVEIVIQESNLIHSHLYLSRVMSFFLRTLSVEGIKMSKPFNCSVLNMAVNNQC